MNEKKKPTLIHMRGGQTDLLLVPENIALIQTAPNGQAMIACSGGGAFQLDALQWRMVQSQLKEAFEVHEIYLAPAAGGIVEA